MREILRKYAIIPSRNLGQNFLINDAVCARIANISNVSPSDNLLEVGPGIGSLTRHLLKCQFSSLILLEKDSRFIDILNNEYSLPKSGLQITLLNEDALKFNIKGINKIISNLPYNIGTELVVRWIESENRPDCMILMLQKEVAERICALERTKSYGRLSILVQALYGCKKEFDIPPSAFSPSPLITSSVVSLYKKSESNIDISKLSVITQKFFSSRRKILKPALAFFGINRPEFAQRRAEELSVKDYLSLL